MGRNNSKELVLRSKGGREIAVSASTAATLRRIMNVGAGYGAKWLGRKTREKLDQLTSGKPSAKRVTNRARRNGGRATNYLNANGLMLNPKSLTTVRAVPDGVVYAFQEVLVSEKVGDLPSGLLATLVLNPAFWPNTMIAMKARMYTRFRILDLKLHYVPNVPSTTSGSITAGVVYHGSEVDTGDFTNYLIKNSGATSHISAPATYDLRVNLDPAKHMNLFGSPDEDVTYGTAFMKMFNSSVTTLPGTVMMSGSVELTGERYGDAVWNASWTSVPTTAKDNAFLIPCVDSSTWGIGSVILGTWSGAAWSWSYKGQTVGTLPTAYVCCTCDMPKN